METASKVQPDIGGGDNLQVLPIRSKKKRVRSEISSCDLRRSPRLAKLPVEFQGLPWVKRARREKVQNADEVEEPQQPAEVEENSDTGGIIFAQDWNSSEALILEDVSNPMSSSEAPTEQPEDSVESIVDVDSSQEQNVALNLTDMFVEMMDELNNIISFND
jgi:hypothetical protein